MLTMSKERKPKLQSIDLVQLIQEVLAIAKTSASEAKVELTWQPAESIENVSVDPEGIHHALLNMVLNAIDATGGRPDAKVLVKATQDPTSTKIVIEDNGIGIPKSQLTTIFSLFESTKGNRGTGLGLPVSQKIVREHGGEISVSSIVDQGTTFTISLPNSNND
jgi:signal transduction histidine kinase